jgi:hypothetical protein
VFPVPHVQGMLLFASLGQAGRQFPPEHVSMIVPLL